MSYSPAGYGRNATRRCAWCYLAFDEERYHHRWFHPTCRTWLAAASGYRDLNGGGLVLAVADCPCGEPGTDLDHRVAVGIAALTGPREYVRAYLPSNLQWLCRSCHSAKTKHDVRRIADLKAGRQRMPL